MLLLLYYLKYFEKLTLIYYFLIKATRNVFIVLLVLVSPTFPLFHFEFHGEIRKEMKARTVSLTHKLEEK